MAGLRLEDCYPPSHVSRDVARRDVTARAFLLMGASCDQSRYSLIIYPGYEAD